MSAKTWNVVLTYKGDITQKLKDCATSCPFKIDGDGNTEQIVECFQGMAAADMSDDEFTKFATPIVLGDASKNGKILRHRWMPVFD
jgi:hypothetical protein